jgi:hypothetical protein
MDNGFSDLIVIQLYLVDLQLDVVVMFDGLIVVVSQNHVRDQENADQKNDEYDDIFYNRRIHRLARQVFWCLVDDPSAKNIFHKLIPLIFRYNESACLSVRPEIKSITSLNM